MSNRFPSRRRIRSGLVAVAAVATVTLAAASAMVHAATVPVDEPSTGTITVTGAGSVQVTPDTAVLSLGVEASAPTGAEAMALLDERSQALTEALLASGIAAEDLQTTNLTLYSTFGEDGSTVTGYNASIQANATIRNIDDVGPTIDTAQQSVGEGLTLSGVMFSFADPESVLEQARIDAVADARRKAQQYAGAADVGLGDIIAIVDGYAQPPVASASIVAERAAAGPPISAGSLDLSATVTITFAIG